MSEDDAADKSRRDPRAWTTAVLAAVCAMVVWSAFKALVHQAPWMHDVTVIGDMGDQSVPFLAYYRDVLTGRANGDLIFAWGMTYGQSFLPTFTQYLANPFNLLVLAFPRTDVTQALFAIQILMGAATAAAMSLLLSALRPGWPAMNVGLSIAWASLPFLTLDASYHPYWGVGVLAMPLMVLTALRFRSGAPQTGRWLAIPVFAVAFLANFYTAYMAAIGAGLIVIALMLAQPASWQRPGQAFASWVLRAALGASMAAVLIVPTYLAVQQSAQPPPPSFQAGSAIDWIAALLPGADTVTRAPAWGPAIPVVALMAMGLMGRPTRPRVVWAALLGLTLASIALPPTALLWHGGDVPDGNSFRQAWVVAGIVTVGAWELAPGAAELARRQTGWARTPVPAILLAALLAGALASTIIVPASVLAGAVLALATGAVVAARGVDRPWGGAAVLAMVAIVMLVGQPSAVRRFADRANVLVDFGWLPGRSTQIERALAAGHGTSAGLDVTRRETGNDPLLLGGTGMTGYSTMMPASSARIAALAGATVRAGGRRIFTRGTTLEHAVFGLNDRQARDRYQARWLVATTMNEGTPASTFAFYSAHLGEQVRRPNLDGAPNAAGWTGTATCPPPATVLYTDAADGPLVVDVDGAVRGLPRGPWAGTLTEIASGGGPWRISLGGGEPADVLFCATAKSVPPGIPAAIRREGHSFRVAAAPGGQATQLLVATPHQSEWACRRSDGEAAPTYESGGLLGIDAAGEAVSCSFEPRGLGLGMGMSAAAAAGAIGWHAAVAYRRRRSGRPRPR
jgi:hypothetical protein